MKRSDIKVLQIPFLVKEKWATICREKKVSQSGLVKAVVDAIEDGSWVPDWSRIQARTPDPTTGKLQRWRDVENMFRQALIDTQNPRKRRKLDNLRAALEGLPISEAQLIAVMNVYAKRKWIELIGEGLNPEVKVLSDSALVLLPMEVT